MPELPQHLETAHLRLRPMALADDDSVYRLRQQCDYKFIGSSSSRDMFDLRFPGELTHDNRAVLAICRKDTDDFVGEVSFSVSNEGDADFTIAVLNEARGNKFGPEVADALLQFAWRMPSVLRVVAQVRTDNERGLNLVRELGFKDAGVKKDGLSESEWQLFEIPRADA